MGLRDVFIVREDVAFGPQLPASASGERQLGKTQHYDPSPFKSPEQLDLSADSPVTLATDEWSLILSALESLDSREGMALIKEIERQLGI